MRIYALFLSGVGLVLSPTSHAQTKAASAVQSMNPDISVSVLTLFKNSKRQGADKDEPGGGFSLQETELQFAANVDPYLRASVMLSVHPAEQEAADPSAPAATEAAEKKTAIEAEEVYVETLGIPYVTFKAGHFHTALGRHNGLHAHAYPFIDSPLISQSLLGDEGLVETGLSAAALVPVPWFMEFTAQALQGDSPILFSSESSSDLASVYRLRNLLELSEEATLDLGLSAAAGQNFYNDRTNVQGADLTLKWRPSKGGKYSSLIWAAEYLKGEVKGRPLDSKQSGYATWIQYQFAERWWVQARTEQAKSEDEGSTAQNKVSALLGFFPSEFSGIRVQYDQLKDAADKPLNTLMVQGNIMIGAHPAHSY